MDKAEVLKKVQQYKLLLMRYMEVDKVYLFGSYARGNSSEDSDIDVAIIVKKIEGDYFVTTPILWKLRREIDDRIEPILLENDNDRSGFLSNIIENGIEII